MIVVSLFDDPVPDDDQQRVEQFIAERPVVPQHVFERWSDTRQFTYLIERDEDSALKEQDQAAWYLERAEHYRQMLKELR